MEEPQYLQELGIPKRIEGISIPSILIGIGVVTVVLIIIVILAVEVEQKITKFNGKGRKKDGGKGKKPNQR